MAEDKKLKETSPEVKNQTLAVQRALINNPQRGIVGMYSKGLLVVNNGHNAVNLRYNDRPDEDTELVLNQMFIRDAIAYYVKNLRVESDG